MRRVFVSAVLTAVVLLFGTTAAIADPPSFSGWGTATADGVIGVSEWEGAATYDFVVNLPDGGGTTPGRFYVMNDESNLYFALSVDRPKLDWSDFFAGFEGTDDSFFIRSDDVFLDNWSWHNDTELGGTNDGSGAASNDGTHSYYEMWHPLDSADDTHDFSLALGDTVGFFVSVRLCGTTRCADTNVPPWGFWQLTIAEPPIEHMLAALRSDVEGVGPGASLAHKVEAAQTAYLAGNESEACSILGAFINQVEAQSGKHIEAVIADALIGDATRIRAVLGCY